MKKYPALLITLAFLLYGLIRLGVGSFLLSQEMGLIDVAAFREPIVEIGQFLAKAADKQLLPFSVAGYLVYIALMGFVLSAGAVAILKNKSSGFSFIAAFLLLYTLLFVNFQTINPKVIHLAVCALLFVVLFWLKGGWAGVLKTTPQ
jgi:hypothetical protein